MMLTRLELSRFRCIEHAHLEFNPRCNLIIGANASGKTSLLEAIFFLGSGRSFRTHQIELLVRRGADDFVAVGHLSSEIGQEVIGIRADRQGREIRINGNPVRRLAELAVRLPVQVIDPEAHRLLEDGPNIRRRYLDWGVFHVEPGFHAAWRSYQRALSQRNALLRAKQSDAALNSWNRELLIHGTKVAELRDRYVAALKPFVIDLGRRLLGLEVDVEHSRGWSRQISFESALDESRVRDCLRGATTVGPHRADLLVKIERNLARERISRGQQKLLAAAIILAQQQQRVASGAHPACLLLDDPAAELDVDNLRKLLEAVADTPAQLLVTAISRSVIEFFPQAQMFHVKHGVIESL